jgi:hypothetical protein
MTSMWRIEEMIKVSALKKTLPEMTDASSSIVITITGTFTEMENYWRYLAREGILPFKD